MMNRISSRDLQPISEITDKNQQTSVVNMIYLSLQPFIPSGSDFNKSKELFQELGFEIEWAEDELVGFRNGACKFILQKYENKAFAENLMLAVKIPDVDSFWDSITHKN